MKVHTLVVTREDDWTRYELECPGPDESCREWVECFGEHDDDAMWDNDGGAHGEEHERIDGRWYVQGKPNHCWAARHMYLSDAANEDGEREPGRYPVIPRAVDGEFLELLPAEETR